MHGMRFLHTRPARIPYALQALAEKTDLNYALGQVQSYYAACTFIKQARSRLF